MTRSTWAAAIPLVIVVAAASVAHAAPIEGRWRLVTQSYGNGGQNIAPEDQPVRLELRSVAGGVEGKIWAGSDERRAVDWPAFSADAGLVPVEVARRGLTETGAVEAVYRVTPSPGDDLVLEIRETYRVAEDGASLDGTMEVRFAGGTMNRGGYVLHRHFVRER